MNQASNGSSAADNAQTLAAEADSPTRGLSDFHEHTATKQITAEHKPMSSGANSQGGDSTHVIIQPQPIFVNTQAQAKFPSGAPTIVATKAEPQNKVTVKPREFVLGEDEPPQKRNKLSEAEFLTKRRRGNVSPRHAKLLQDNSHASQLHLNNAEMKIQNSQANMAAEQQMIVPQTVPLSSATPFQQPRSKSSRKSFSEKPEAPYSNTVSVQINNNEDRLIESVLDSQKIIVDLQRFEQQLSSRRQHQEVEGSLSERKPSLGAFGKRNNSHVVSLSNRRGSLVSPFQQLKHDLTIDEVKQNQFSSVMKIMEPYFKEKPTAQTVSNLEEQMRQRVIPHSYQTLKKQKESIQASELRRQAGGLAVRTIVNNSHLYIADPAKKDEIEEAFAKRVLDHQVGRVIQAKQQVQLPKDLVLMKIAQKQVEEQKQRFTQEAQLAMTPTRTNRRGASLPTIAGNSEPRQANRTDLNQDSSLNLINSSQKHAGLLKLLNQRSDLDMANESTTIQDGTAVGFHITDLLKQATTAGPRPNNSILQATVEFYKRAVKDNEMLKINKELIIKNYRLRVVDANKDITPEDRKLMHKNPGTTIHVANSLIKPEIYRYSTKVSNALQEVFIDMVARSHSTRQQKLPSTQQQFDALTFDQESELQPPETTTPDVQIRRDSQRAIATRSDRKQVPPSNTSQQRKVTPFTANTGLQGLRSNSQSSGVYYEQHELQAMQVASHKINLWLNSVDAEYDDSLELYQRQVYEMMNDNSKRYVLQNGQLAPLTHKEIAQRMIGPKQTQLTTQPRVMANEEMTAITRIADKPYLHLMRSIVVPELKEFLYDFNKKTAKYVDPSMLLKSHQNPVVQIVDYEQQRDAVAVVRVEFTHLDPHPIQAINLSQDLFFEEYLVNDLIALLKTGEKVHAQTEFMFVEMGGQFELKLIDVYVDSYSPQTRWFHIYNKELGVDTYRSRFNLRLDTDTPDFLEDNRDLIDFWKEHSSQFLKLQRLIEAEMTRRYDYLEFNDDSRKRILQMVGSLQHYERKIVERVIVQVEALYVFSLLKSALASQRQDPFVKNMLINFRVDFDSPALEVKMSAFKVKEDLHEGIYAFRFNAMKNQLQKCSLSMSNAKYMALPKLLYGMTWESVYKQIDLIFQTPIPCQTLIEAKYQTKCTTLHELELEVNTYPLHHQTWISAQRVIQERFQQMLKTQWAETVAEKIYQFIKDDFVFDTVLDFTEEQIDPRLAKVLAQIKQYQATMLYTVFEKGLRSYMRFLLGFAMRNPDIRSSKIVQTIRKSNEMRLINDDPNFVQPEDEDINDLDLIPLSLKPFVKLQAEIQVTGKMRNRKYKVITSPELDTIHSDLFSVIRQIHAATRELHRVESIIFPRLQLEEKYISQPDLRNNAKIAHILKLFDKLLVQCVAGCKSRIQQFQGFLTIFEKKVDGVVLELKKESFALANEASDDDEVSVDQEQELMDSIMEEEQTPAQQTQVKPSTRQVSDDSAENSSEQSEDDDDDQAGGAQQNMMAYKSVEIDQTLMRNELTSIRQHRYSVLTNCANTYDFGLLKIDCVPYKTVLIQHCEALELELESYLRNEFLEKMRNCQSEITALKGRLDEQVSSIDDVIALLDYIDSLKRQDNKVEEIADFIDVMTRQVEFIDSLKIEFDLETRLQFWQMRNWPRIFDKWLKERKQQLLEQKELLVEQMTVECQNVKEMVADFKSAIKEMLTKGLTVLDDTQSERRESKLKELFVKMAPNQQQSLVPVEIPRATTFDWLASETKWYQRLFDTSLAMKFFQKLNELKARFDDLDRLTVQINRRQALLGIDKTEFKEAKTIMDDLKPLYDLWSVADQYRELLVQWFEDSLSLLDASVVENKLEEWHIEIKRLQKSPIVQTNAKQQEVLSYLLDSVFYSLKYLPLVKTIRVKGLTPRHWRQINNELGFNIDPASTCLLRLIGMQLMSDDNLSKIKQVSDIAQKEHAIQMQTEALELEMKAVQFEFTNLIGSVPGQPLRTVRKLEANQTKFNEFQLRVQVLKMNPYMRNFFERLLDIEKIVKAALEILAEFTIFQSKWHYLFGIFSENALADSLSYELKIWKTVDKFYKVQVRAMWETPEVWRVSQKEGLLGTLRKMNTEIDQCRAGLQKFLEAKRQLFPRLYFIQSEELLKIYGRHNQLIQEMASGAHNSFITHVFQGVHRLIFNSQLCVIGVESQDGERIFIDTPIRTSLSLEVWLKHLEKALTQEMKYQILLAYMEMDADCPQVPEDPRELREYKKLQKFQVRRVSKNVLYEWINKFSGQATYVCQQLWLTQKIHAFFDGAALKAKYVEQVNRQRVAVSQLPGQATTQAQSDSTDSEVDIYQLSDEESIDEDEPAYNPTETAQVEDDQTNIEETAQQSQSKFKAKSRLSVVDRAMRFWHRFTPNDAQHPHDVLVDIKNSVLQKTQFMIANLNQPLTPASYNATVGLITYTLHQRDCLQEMINRKQYRQTDYEWEIQFKFYLDKLSQTFSSVLPSDLDKKQHQWIEKLDVSEMEVRFELFHIQRSYGFEYLGNATRLVISPLTARAQRAMFLACHFQFGSAVEGPFGTGKTETIKDMQNVIGKPIAAVTQTDFTIDEIVKFMKGVMMCGHAVLLDEFNRMHSEQLSFMIQIVTQIQNAVRSQTRLVQLDDSQKVPIDLNASIFITMNPGYSGRVDLPPNLKNLFRPVQMIVPDWQLITESLLARAGFSQCFQLSQKLAHFQKLANEMMQRHSHVQRDFGLRAIRAIVGIAEILKRQVQGLTNSDLPDIINGHTMTVVAWKDQKLINDVIAELNSEKETTKILVQSQQLDSADSLPKAVASAEEEELSAKSKFIGQFFEVAFKSDLSREDRQKQALLQQIGASTDDDSLEELIIIKAMKDFNNAKFTDQDHKVISQLIIDVFSGHEATQLNETDRKVVEQKSDYGNLKELMQQHMLSAKLEHSMKMEALCYQMYEVTQVKAGCIVLGQTQAAKSTLIETLSGALNYASLNELKLRVAQVRKRKLIDAVFASPQVAQLLPAAVIKRFAKQIRQAQKQSQTSLGSLHNVHSSGHKDTGVALDGKKKKQKMTEKQKMALWHELYQKTKLDRVEIFQLEQELVIRGVKTKRVNPKAIDRSNLLGYTDAQSGVWEEGQLTAVIKEFSTASQTTKNWVHIDGPLDHVWAENLNSALDESRRIYLANGEIVKISEQTCLIFEADSLKNLTPATVSRCGLVHMNRDECNNPKYILNQYLHRLPPNTQDNLKDLDQQVNWLMPTCLKILEEERAAQRLLIPVDQFWLVQNIIKVFDGFMCQYWIDYINGNKSDWEDAPQQNALKACTQAYGYHEDHYDIVALAQEDTVKLNPDSLECRFRAMKIKSAVNANTANESGKRMAVNDFISNEMRVENSLKFMPLWMEAFFLTALTASFRSILTPQAQQRLSDALKVKYEERKGDFSTYQKLKKKQLQAREEQKKKEQKALLKAMMSKTGMTSSDMNATQRSNTSKQKNLIQSIKTISELSGFSLRFEEPTNDANKPMFITDFPFTNEHGLNMFDYYFSLDNSQWMRFDVSEQQVRMSQLYNKLPPQLQSPCNIVVPTMQWVKDFYMMECLLTAHKPFVLIGQRASGKSTLMKEMLFTQTQQFCDRLLADHVGCTWRTDANSFKQQLVKYMRIIKSVKVQPPTEEAHQAHPTEEPVFETDSDVSRDDGQPATADSKKDAKGDEEVKSNNTDTQNSALLEELHKQIQRERPPRKLRPQDPNVSLAIYLEDLHMSNADSFTDSSTAESLRDLIAYRQVYETKKRQIRLVESVNVVSCVNVAQNKISQRLLRHFAPIGVQLLDDTTSVTVVCQMLEIFGTQWTNFAQQRIKNICSALYDINRHCHEQLRPTPIKVQYTFNHREIFKMLAAFCKVEPSYLKDTQSLCKLFYHESMRQYGDRILMKHDLSWLSNAIKAVCVKHFIEGNVSSYDFTKTSGADQQSLLEKFPIENPESVWFSTLNHEVEGFYSEVKVPKTVRNLITRQIDRYNEQQDTKKLSLVLFDELYTHLFKIMRAVNTNGGHLIIVGLRGFATNELMKLAAFILGKQFSALEMHPEFSDQDWKQNLRSKIIAASQDDKQQCFIIEEYRMVNPNWYRDIEALMTNHIVTDCMLESDIPSVMTALKIQQRRFGRQRASQIEGNLDVKAIKDDQNTLSNPEKMGKVIQTFSKQKPEQDQQNSVSMSTILKENLKEVQKEPNLSNDLYSFMLKRVRKNLHFVMTFTPSGQNFREKMQSHSQLMLNSSLIWIQQLEVNDLAQIGEQVFLDELQDEHRKRLVQDTERDPRMDADVLAQVRIESNQILKACISIYKITCEFADKYYEKHEHRLYFTPIFFLRSLTAYRRLLGQRKNNVTDTVSRFEDGLETISQSRQEVEAYRQEILAEMPTLIQQNDHVVQIVVDLQAQIDYLQQQKVEFLETEKYGAEGSKQAKAALEEAQYQMDSLVPALNNSLRTMQKISKLEIAEIRQMMHPPPLVKLVMKAICILLDVEPAIKKGKDGRPKLSYWRAAISPLVLGDPNFADRLEKFDRSSVSPEKMAVIEELMADPDYNQEAIKKSSFAAENLFQWVKALRDYYYILKELEPRKQALLEAEKVYHQATDTNQHQKDQIKALTGELANLNSLLEEKTALAHELKARIHDRTARRRRAEQLIRQLNAEKQKWVVGQRLLVNSNESVVGDVVLAAAIIVYGGGFAYSYRRQLVEKWQKFALKPEGLSASSGFQIQELFGDNLQIRDWHNNHLPKDVLSTDNALIMDKTTQYITCIDPQQQASTWLKAQHSASGLIITNLQDPNIRKTLEIAIEMGKQVLVEDILDRVDIHIESLVKKEIHRFEETHFIKFCRKQLKLDPSFGLYLVTNLPKPHFDVNLTNYSTVVNFYVTVEGLSQNLLDLIVANERQDLETNYLQSLEKTFTAVKDLKVIEEDLLKKLREDSADKLLADEAGIEMLKDSAKHSESIATHLRRIQQTSEFLEKARTVYTPVAFRAATLYTGIQELQTLNSMYKYSLAWFMRQFSAMLALVNQLKPTKKNSKVPHTVTINSEEFVLKSFEMSPEYRVDLLMKTFTQEIMRKVIFSVYQPDRQLVTYFLTLKVLQAEQLTSDELLAFSIAGSREVTDSDAEYSEVAKDLPWLTNVMWSDLKSLQTIQPFNSDNLTTHILQNKSLWASIVDADCLDYDRLPNQAQLSLDQFPEIDIRDAIDAVYKKIQIYLADPRDVPEKSIAVTRTPPKSAKKEAQLQEYTEEQILADEDLWKVSDDSDEGESYYDLKARNKAFYKDEEAITQEEKVMARFMVERAPGSVKRIGPDDHRLMTKMERKNFQLRQNVLKRTVEFAIAKCLRPDLIKASLHQLTSTIYDFSYTGFNPEILSQFIDQSGTLALRPGQKSLALPKKENIENNLQKLISEAYTDSTQFTPILFLVSHSVNVLDELTQFVPPGTKLHNLQAGQDTQLQQLLKSSTITGEWLLVQNLHLSQDTVQLLSSQKLLGQDTHAKFRLWLTTCSAEVSEVLVKKSIKVALEQPSNIKMKIERHLMGLKEGVFRRGQETGIYHKNVFFGLSYLHGVLEGRRSYASLGWSIAYAFDRNDFETSNAVLDIYLKRDFDHKLESLKVMKYIFAQINFAGKISRTEDQRKLQAHVDDLFGEEITLAYETPTNMGQSHFGFPAKDCDLLWIVNNEFPKWDHFEIFGFNRNIYRQQSKRDAGLLLDHLKVLNAQVLKEQGYANVHVDLENQLRRFAMQRFGSSKLDGLVNDLVSLQKHLAHSSLDQTIQTDGDRYDSRIEMAKLLERDQNDCQVARYARRVREQLATLLEPYHSDKQIQCPVLYTLDKEIKQYQALVQVMIQTFDEFLDHLTGDSVLPYRLEKLWLRIQNNQIPETWLKACYDTAHTSLACFFADLLENVTWFNSLLNSRLSTTIYRVSGFYNPRQLILSHLQKYAQQRHVQLSTLKQRFTVVKSEEEELQPGEVLLKGLWIEGAKWDVESGLLVEQDDARVQSRFPVLKLGYEPATTPEIYDEEFHQFPQDNPPPTKAELKQKRQAAKKKPSALKQEPAPPLLGQETYTYKCPVFATTNRLSQGGVGQENKPLFYVELQSHTKARKWVKRAVALLLEPSVLE